MKKLSLIICVFVAFSILLCSCSERVYPGESLNEKVSADENLTYKFISGETELPNAYTSYKNYAQQFAFTMLKNSYEKSGNTALSTSGLYAQLSLLENAASGSTQKELKALTGKNLNPDELNACNGYFFSRLEALSNEEKGYFLDIDSNIFFNGGTTIGQEFLLKNADYYNQGLFRLDFSGENALNSINSYIAAQTNDKVNALFRSLNPESDIYSSSTAFMRDKWLDGYEKENVATSAFKGRNGNVDAEFMTSTEYFLKGKKCTGFEKDFKNTPCKFIALLPNEDISIYKFINELNYEEYQDIVSSMSVFKTCEASLPQFSVKYESSLTSQLNNAGVYEIFNVSGDFSNLFKGETARVADVLQSLELSVSPAGVGVNKVNTSKSTKKDAEYKVELNRPFVFMIVDNESYIPIYIGVVSEI